jgi:hypothetical protein
MIFTMAQEPAASKRPVETTPEDDVEKFLSEQKAVEGKRHDLIKEVLRQKEAAIKAFDEKLAKLGHHEPTARTSKRNHHKHDSEKKASE